MDYGLILDDKQKKHVLMDKFEEQKNAIKYFLEDKDYEYETSIPFLEKLVTVMDEFLKENLPSKSEQ